MSDALSVSVSVPTKVITEYYYSRWVSLAFSLLLSSASGSGYAFGIWSSVLKGPPLNLSANDVSLNGSISNLGLYLGVINGVLYGHVGPKITILIGVLLVSFGFICNYLLLSGIGFPASLPLLCFFSFVAQFGSSFLQTAAMSTGVRNFPALSRGQIGGLVKGTFALASSTLGEYYLALFSTNTLNYLLFVAIYVPCMALICLPFINLIPKETVERYQEENERSQLTLHARLFEHAADAKDKEKEKDKDKHQISNAAGKVNGGGEGVNDAEEEKSKSWRELAGRPAALQVELATLSQTVTMVDSSTPTNGIAALVGLAQANSEGTVSLRFNDKELERKNSHTLPSPDVLRSPSAAAATVAKTAKTVSVKVPPRSKRPLNVVYRVLAKLSPSGPLNPQTMMYGYLILAFSLGIYVCIVAAIEAKEAVSQGLRIGGFILTDLLAISFILVGASFGDFRIKFQRVVPADHHETKMHWLWQWLWRGAGQGGHGHGHAAADESKTLWYAVTTLNFYLLLLAQFCVAGSGLVLINNMSDISKAYAATDSSAVTNDPSLLVVIVGFGSFGGRVFCGFVSDRTIRYVTRPMYHSMAAFLSSFCFALLASSLNYNALYAVALIEGFAYGVAFSTMTSMAADLFGPTHHAAIYGALDLGPCAGSISFAYLIKNVYYTQGTNVPASQLKTLGNYCFGYTCFQNTFIICCCATLFASTLSLAVHFRTKEVYSKLREKLEAMRRTEAEKKKQQIEMLKQQRELEEEDAQKLEKLEQEEAADATLPTEVKAPPQNQELEEKHQEQHEDKTAANAIAAPRGSVSASSNTDGDASKVVKFHIHNLEHEFEHQQQQPLE